MLDLEERPLVTLGLREGPISLAKEAAAQVGTPVVEFDDIRSFTNYLYSELPLAVLVRPGQLAQSTCFHMRTQLRFADVPILGAATDCGDVAFVELFMWGGDDLVQMQSSEGLARRLRLIRQRPEIPTSRSSAAGIALVAGADPQWRSVVARALFHGGYRIRYVTTSAELLTDLATHTPAIVVASEGLRPNGAGRALRETRPSSSVPWIIVAAPKRLPSIAAELRGVEQLAFVDAFGPPENTLFVANELLFGYGVDKRTATRVLYGSSVAFRNAGGERDDVGLTYNVSTGGLFIRTLAPCEVGQEVWLELWPPRSDRRVRLAGRVAWVRPFGSPEGATSPPGCGVQVSEGLAGDLARFTSGVKAFERSLFA